MYQIDFRSSVASPGRRAGDGLELRYGRVEVRFKPSIALSVLATWCISPLMIESRSRRAAAGNVKKSRGLIVAPPP
jgi:hypothetical protein